jgi:hypothetical protein
MRSRALPVLVAAAALVIAICELESVAAVNRWDPSDIGRAAGMSSYLLPEELPDEEDALITVRVQAAGYARTYRYWVAPDRDVADEVLVPALFDADVQAVTLDGEVEPRLAEPER